MFANEKERELDRAVSGFLVPLQVKLADRDLKSPLTTLSNFGEWSKTGATLTKDHSYNGKLF